MNLSAFLAENALKSENVKYVASHRFVEDGKPVEWEIGCIDSATDEALRKDCTSRVPVPGKRGQFTQETDINQYLGKMAAMCTVYPNLNDAALQDSYKVNGADALLKKMLLPGEYSDYLNKVQEVNGYTISMDELVEEAKNS